MTSLPNLRHAGRRLLERTLSASKDEGALADTLVVLGALPALDWSRVEKGLSLGSRALRASASGNPARPGTSQAQEVLFDLFLRDQQDLSVAGPLMQEAFAHAADIFILRAYRHAPFSDMELAAQRDWFPPFDYKTINRLKSTWKAEPALHGLACAWEAEMKVSGWLQPGLSVHQIKAASPDFQWTPEKATQFLLRRMWPDWVNRQYDHSTPESMRSAVAPALTHQRKNWMDFIPLDVLVSTAITGPNLSASKMASGFLPAMAGLDTSTGRDWSKAFTQPLPLSWVTSELALLREKGAPDAAKNVQAYWRALANHQIQSAVPEFRWFDMMVGEEILSIINHNYTPSRRLINLLTDHLQKTPSTPPVWPEQSSHAMPHAVVLSAWISAAPPELWKKQIQDWGAGHSALDLLGKKETTRKCHGLLAGAVLLRILRAQDDQDLWPSNYSVFWSHFLRADAPTLTTLIKQLSNAGAPGRPNPFDVTVGDPVLVDALARVSEMPTLPVEQNQSWLRKVVLDLQSRVAAPRVTTPRSRM